MKSQKFLLVALLLFFMFQTNVNAYQRYNHVKKFDRYFKKYSKRFFGPFFDWKYFKAQAVAESRLKAKAKSHVGARGIMQIMPNTFKEIKRKSRIIKGNTYQPRWNIAAGIFYNRTIWKTWTSERSFQDRLDFTFASYNAGKGNIVKAQILAKKRNLNPNLWNSIIEVLPKVTGKHSKETITYVEKINLIKRILK